MRSSVVQARIAAVSRDSRSGDRKESLESVESDTRVYVAASPGVDPREIEWIRSGLAIGEISKFAGGVNGDAPTAAATQSNPGRCYRTSTSSGYSSHSPPLSAGSYSCYASATSALTSASASTKDPYGGLAVIHESESIPRPVWPSAIYQHIEERGSDFKGTYTRRCRVCDCTYSYVLPLPPPPTLLPVPSPPKVSARDILLELSRTLNSVIDGDATAAPEDILRDISRIVSLGINTRNDEIYEYVCPSWTVDDKHQAVPSYAKNVPSKINPDNSKLYVEPRYFYGHSSARFVPLLKNDRTSHKNDGETGGWTKNPGKTTTHCEIFRPYSCKYLNGNNAKLSFELNGISEQRLNGLASTESKYSMQMKCGDIATSSDRPITSPNASNWNRCQSVRGFIGDFDFTLDVTRAERLGRTIARAKRKRRWCRVLTTLFGLVFFVLSVVVVSLSVTRGRKVFGSM